MNEVRLLVEAFDGANKRGEQCALATLVSVEGSSYRRPGARMLVCEGGASTGTISAGCLEGDVVEHAKRVIKAGEAKLFEYDTASTSDEMAWGLGLGCNGIVRVLVEPLASTSLYVEALRRSCEAHAGASPITVATVYQHTSSGSARAKGRVAIGARLFIDEGGETGRENLSDEVASLIEEDVRMTARAQSLSAGVYEVAGGSLKVFVETLLPPVHLVVFGAGHDALPVVELARGLGWQTEVVDPQARSASRSRFAIADRVTLARPEELCSRVAITPRTLTLLMSHNYSHDLELLKFLLSSPARYIGVMGPRKRTERMLNELAANEDAYRLEETELARLYSPAGLDVGANTPAEIALSIVAEMRAVLDGRRGGMLRARRGSIHGSPDDGERVLWTEEQVLPVALA
ncbi:MAG TPA: XdhC family protein [Pyrinomonadaceae bacterium]|jgi:xanthine/CO dehydrogenase XdhC/CoxF family maturation factor|nr:XdhC family protein [Pyrinomonadaceae bacterium]